MAVLNGPATKFTTPRNTVVMRGSPSKCCARSKSTKDTWTKFPTLNTVLVLKAVPREKRQLMNMYIYVYIRICIALLPVNKYKEEQVRGEMWDWRGGMKTDSFWLRVRVRVIIIYEITSLKRLVEGSISYYGINNKRETDGFCLRIAGNLPPISIRTLFFSIAKTTPSKCWPCTSSPRIYLYTYMYNISIANAQIYTTLSRNS